jgi:multidrug efflux system membrane fusion protein
VKRVLPYLIFLLIAGGVAAYVYKDKLFPAQPGADGQAAAQAQQGGRRGGGGGGGGRRGGNQPVPVTVEKPVIADVPVYLTGVGTVQAYNTATVRAQVSGRLTEVSFREGQEVKAGDVLAKIDPVLYQAAYDQAVAKKGIDEALLENARRDAARYASLARSEASSQQQADTARSLVAQYEATIRQDQAAIDTAKANLDYAIVKAPIAGRTGLRLVDTGNLVSASDATGIVVITQLQPISCVFTLPEDYVSQILDAKAQGDVPLQAVTGADIIAEGKLEVVDNQVDQSTGTVRLKGSYPNEKNRLWPGQYVNVKLRLKVLKDAITVPSVAVQQGASGSYVFTVTEDGRAKVTPVKVTQEGEQRAVIAEGLAATQTVITSGFASLQDNSRLQIDQPQAGQPGQERQRRRRDTPEGANAAPDGAGAAQAQTQPPSQAQRGGSPDGQRERGERRRRGEDRADAGDGQQSQRRRGDGQQQSGTPQQQ